MSRFVINRRFLTTIGMVLSLVSSSFIQIQPSYADSWAELLKPLVKNVIVPGASMGMKKLMERNEKKHAENTTDPTAAESGTTVEQSAASSTTTQEDASASFSMPEEPMSGSEYTMIPTPEEPISTAANMVEPSAEVPPPPPPPPVATP